MYSALDKYAPVKEYIVKSSDKPWITSKFKELIADRNRAFAQGDDCVYKRLRNRVNRLRVELQHRFNNKQVDCLKSYDPRRWWKSIKKLCGLVANDNFNIDRLTFQGQDIRQDELSDVINNFLVSIGESIRPINGDSLSNFRNQLPICPDDFVVSEYAVYTALSRSKISSAGPDGLDASLLVRLADVLAAPVCSIINSSIRQGVVPGQWKCSRVVPIPKCSPAERIETYFRPISFTPILSKIAESFMCSFFNDHFSKSIDKYQFGCTQNRSTVHALIKFSHELFQPLIVLLILLEFYLLIL